MTVVSKSEFARRLGVAKSAVTYWAKNDRLVLTLDGKVDLEASLERLRDTEANWGVAQYWREHRRAKSGDMSDDDDEAASATAELKHWRAVREHYAALKAKIDYELAAGLWIDREDFEYAARDIGAYTRRRIEEIADRAAPLLAREKTVEETREILHAEVMEALRDILDHIERASEKMSDRRAR
jgi:transcriptional regulator with XRE-family HTH domain